MVDIPVRDLRELHYNSDRLRGIFFDMDCSGEGGDTLFVPKEKISDEDLEYGKELILKINNKIVDLDVETPNINNKVTSPEKGTAKELKAPSKGGKIIELLTEYYGKHDFIIEYGADKRVTIRKNMVVMYDDCLLYYYPDKHYTDDNLDVPLGIIVINSIIGIKRSG